MERLNEKIKKESDRDEEETRIFANKTADYAS